MKKRTAAGGLIVLGILVGTWLSGLFPDFGLGTGPGGSGSDGAGTDQNDSEWPSDTRVSLTSESRPVPPDTPSPSRPVDPEFAPEPLQVVRVVIADREYFLRTTVDGQTHDRPVALNELVELAKRVPGDEDGVKVRVYRKASARTTAELALQQQLAEAGLKPEEIQEHEGLIE